MNEDMFKDGATKEQKEIIRRYFEGTTFKTLVKEYSAAHLVKSDKTNKDIAIPKEAAAKK